MTDKASAFARVEKLLADANLPVASKDTDRPWGGFFVIDEGHSRAFIQTFFPGEDAEDLMKGKVSPKILVVEPGKRLSWQYHHRRAELWRVVESGVLVAASDTDEEQPPVTRMPGDVVHLKCGQRHRLIGKEEWGVVAEIWQHTDPLNPSDESDIVRLQDDFGRGS